MNWVFIDIDQTISDTVVDSHGSEDRWFQAFSDAKPIQAVVKLVHNLKSPVVFLTNRRERFKDVTENWLKSQNIHTACVLRPNDEPLTHGEFKAKWIKALLSPGDTVVVIDDDPNGSVEAACKEHGWVHLKVTTYPKERIQ